MLQLARKNDKDKVCDLWPRKFPLLDGKSCNLKKKFQGLWPSILLQKLLKSIQCSIRISSNIFVSLHDTNLAQGHNGKEIYHM
jgi:hypothetical protein